MTPNKKLQVFVSSTYEDLKEERQAAVEAILTAGHIPAGMELFAAGDQSQMEVIKRWICESDVYLLILGGRYGSIEPKSEKSYIQLEYEYALEKGKALFAVVIREDGIDRKLRELGRKAIEQVHPQKLEAFRKTVLSKMVRMWSDTKDIKLAILETLSEFSRRDELVGWIHASQAVDAKALEEMVRLSAENASLRQQLSAIKADTYNGVSFDEMLGLLQEEKINSTNLLQVLRSNADILARGDSVGYHEPVLKLARFGLLTSRESAAGPTYLYCTLTDDGRKFLLQLKVRKLD